MREKLLSNLETNLKGDYDKNNKQSSILSIVQILKCCQIQNGFRRNWHWVELARSQPSPSVLCKQGGLSGRVLSPL